MSMLYFVVYHAFYQTYQTTIPLITFVGTIELYMVERELNKKKLQGIMMVTFPLYYLIGAYLSAHVLIFTKYMV